MKNIGPENIYWLFSSSAQAIAAFIGFLTAGFYFILNKMDDNLAKDETLEEINEEIKKQHFFKLKTLCVLTGISIISSLGMVYFNVFDFGLKNVLVIIVSSANILTIIWAIVFIIKLIDPAKIPKTAQKLIEKDKNIDRVDKRKTVSIGEFLEKFIQLEKLLRKYEDKVYLYSGSKNRIRNFVSLAEIVKYLHQKEIVDSKTLQDFIEINKIRNLTAHGHINRVDKRIVILLDNILKEAKKISKVLDHEGN